LVCLSGADTVPPAAIATVTGQSATLAALAGDGSSAVPVTGADITTAVAIDLVKQVLCWLRYLLLLTIAF